MNTYCLKCNVELKPGIAIDPKGSDPLDRLSWNYPLLKAADIELKECLKCPSCGHSEENESDHFMIRYR